MGVFNDLTNREEEISTKEQLKELENKFNSVGLSIFDTCLLFDLCNRLIKETEENALIIEQLHNDCDQYREALTINTLLDQDLLDDNEMGNPVG